MASTTHRRRPPPAERFRSMVRNREEELAFYDDPPPSISESEIVGFYEEVLSELTFNSNSIIGDLTAIAGEQRRFARGIAGAVCRRILKVPVDLKLPSLYLLDSIVKEVGREYVGCFAACLPKVFSEVYNQVDPSLYPAMRRLLGTWTPVFHPSILRKIKDELQFSTPSNQQLTSLADTRYSESPSPGPSHGTHVNAKYFERRAGPGNDEDLGNEEGLSETPERNISESPGRWSGASSQFHDTRHMKEGSSGLQVYGHKPCIQVGDRSSDCFELPSSGHKIARAGSPRTVAMCTSSMGGVDRPLPNLKRRRSRSPPIIEHSRSISPANDRFQGDISLERVERNSSSHPRYGFGHDRAPDRNGLAERRWASDNSVQRQETSIGYELNHSYAKQRSRELIDAYGDHRETINFQEKFPKVQRQDVIGMDSKGTTKNWQRSEEEEFIWEDMSPTLADHSNRKAQQPFRHSTESHGVSEPEDFLLESDLRNGWGDQASLHPLDEDKIPVQRYAYGSRNKYLDGAVSQSELLFDYRKPHHLQEPGTSFSFPYNSQKSLRPNSQSRTLQFPYSVRGAIPSAGQKLPATYDDFPDAELPLRGLSHIHPGNSNVYTPAIQKHWAQRPYSPPHSTSVIRPPVLESEPPRTKQFSPSELVEGSNLEISQGRNSSSALPWQQYGVADRRTITPNAPFQSGLDSIHVRHQSQESSTRRQFQDVHMRSLPPSEPRVSTYFIPQPSSHVHTPEDVVKRSDFSSSLLGVPSSAGMHSMLETGFHGHQGVLPPIPAGSHPTSSQKATTSQNMSSIISPSLISTLMAQGLISLPPPVQSQDSVGVEFNTEHLKVRHESAVNALYTDLPRQCTTCGLRFRCQEEHRSHMDWHVTKNRTSKNRKQKPSRSWFVNGNEWLSGAEVLGTNVSHGFLPTEAVAENKEVREMVVFADENQNTCALCGELFEEFYSDETEEWMYKHAVYLNAPPGNMEGLDPSQWGPIVHDKCRPEPVEDMGLS